MSNYNGPRTARPFSYYTFILGAVILVIGALLAAGGVWLAWLGGSLYYFPAGLGLMISGYLLMRQSTAGVWAYVLVYVLTLAWAYWEVGLDGWALVPRVVAPTVLLLLVLLTLGFGLSRSRAGDYRPYAAVLFAAVLAGLSVAGWDPIAWTAWAQVEPAPQPGAAPQTAPQAEPGTQPSVSPPPQTSPEAEAESEAEPPAALAPATQGAAEPAAAPAARQPGEMREAGQDWPAYGGSDTATRYSPLNQINRDNVSRLQVAWIYRTGAMPKEKKQYAAETTPLKVGDDLFLCSALNTLIAVDAQSGREEWRFDPQVSDDAIPYSASCRGVSYYRNPAAGENDACAERIIEGTIDARLIAVDAKTGQPCVDFGNGGEVSISTGLGDTVPGWVSITSPPVIVRGIIVTGHQVKDGQAEDSPSGVIRGYDAVTGELVWAWDLGNPQLAGLPPEGQTYTRGTPNMWTSAVGDEELGLVYLPMGNSAVDYYGANRSPAENEFATSLVALNVTTGKPAWHFQTVHYDVWDYDLGSQPSLVDVQKDGATVPAIVLASKQGEIYVLDRRSGEPLFPVEERPVPQGGVEPENLSQTQPFSKFHTLAMPDLTERDMWGMSPLDQLWCRIQFHRAVYDGIYTPPTTDKPYIQYPGYNGGSDWGSLAIDPQRGVIIANYNDMPNFNRLVPREKVEEAGVRPITEPQNEDAPEDLAPQAGATYGIDVNAGWRLGFTGLMCKQPPYGGIRAIDLATGKTLWDRPLGTARRNGPFGIPSLLPFDIGTPNNGGPLVTAGGLVFIAAATDDLIRAMDIETGETVWSDALPAGGQATPMTFEANGVQYVAIFAGGHHFMETPIGDYLVAYALPSQ